MIDEGGRPYQASGGKLPAGQEYETLDRRLRSCGDFARTFKQLRRIMTVDRVEDHWSKTLQADVEIRPVLDQFKVYIDGVHSYTAWDLADAEQFLDSISQLQGVDNE